MEVYLIRHTQVAVGKDTCYGQSDVSLADTFLQDAEQLKNQLPNDFDAVYCSPLKRCKDLAIALELDNIHFDNSLMEMNFGDWENQKWNDLNQEDLNNWMTDFVKAKIPNGENLIELFDRVKQFLDNLRKQQHKKVLIITHSGVIRCLWAYTLEIPLTNIFKIPVDYGQKLIINLSTEHKFDSIIKTG
jgi:alpha-ribazole phosphatase